jgi:hypothetical protein
MEKEFKQCKHCLNTLVRFYLGTNKHNSGIYKSEDGKLWHGRVCPDCYKALQQDKRKQAIQPNPEVVKVCGECNTEFRTKSKKKKYCSDSCRYKSAYKVSRL